MVIATVVYRRIGTSRDRNRLLHYTGTKHRSWELAAQKASANLCSQPHWHIGGLDGRTLVYTHAVLVPQKQLSLAFRARSNPLTSRPTKEQRHG
jgi:hypothetical protein